MTRVNGGELIRRAYSERFAIPAFNVSNMETAQGVLAAAEQARSPVFAQLSPGAIAYAGYDTLTRLVLDLAEQASVPVIVHLDHCRDLEVVERALADGYGSVMFDGSRLTFADNVRLTSRVLERAAQTGASVEAEIGVIGGIADSSLDEARRQASDPDEAARFVAACPVDVLAPAVGTLHGMPDDAVELDLQLISAIARAVGRPLALHGGSGVARTQLRAAIDTGVVKVNISSRVSRAMAAGIRACWAEDPAQLDLRRYLAAGRDGVAAMAAEYFDLTGSRGTAGAGERLPGAVAWAAVADPD
jgi:ketose-bisphosphate aldolase